LTFAEETTLRLLSRHEKTSCSLSFLRPVNTELGLLSGVSEKASRCGLLCSELGLILFKMNLTLRNNLVESFIQNVVDRFFGFELDLIDL
jgi:hypothetical protein